MQTGLSKRWIETVLLRKCNKILCTRPLHRGWIHTCNTWLRFCDKSMRKNRNDRKTNIRGAQIQLWSCRIETMSWPNSHARGSVDKTMWGADVQTNRGLDGLFWSPFCPKKRKENQEYKQMNGCFTLLSVQLNISPMVVKQQRPSHPSFPRKEGTASTRAQRKLIQPSVRLFNFNNMALSD